MAAATVFCQRLFAPNSSGARQVLGEHSELCRSDPLFISLLGRWEGEVIVFIHPIVSYRRELRTRRGGAGEACWLLEHSVTIVDLFSSWFVSVSDSNEWAFHSCGSCQNCLACRPSAPAPAPTPSSTPGPEEAIHRGAARRAGVRTSGIPG